MSFSTGKFPTRWKTANVTPLFKQGAASDPSNYRPISVLPVVSKVRLCIKVGRGQGDGDIETRVWGLGTWGRETRDLRTSSMGRGDVWDGNAGKSNTGTQGTRDVNICCKSRR